MNRRDELIILSCAPPSSSNFNEHFLCRFARATRFLPHTSTSSVPTAAAHDEHAAYETTDHGVDGENYSHASQHDAYEYSYSADAASELAASNTDDYSGANNDAAAHSTYAGHDDHDAVQDPEISTHTEATAGVDVADSTALNVSDPPGGAVEENGEEGDSNAESGIVNGDDESATAVETEHPEATSEHIAPAADAKEAEEDRGNIGDAPARLDAEPSEATEEDNGEAQVHASAEATTAAADTGAEEKSSTDKDPDAEQEVADDQIVQGADTPVNATTGEQTTKGEGAEDASVNVGQQTTEEVGDANRTEDAPQGPDTNVTEATIARDADVAETDPLGNEENEGATTTTSQSVRENEESAVEEASADDAASPATPAANAETGGEADREGADPGSKQKLGRTFSVEARARENVSKLPPKGDLLWEAVLDDKSGQYYYWNHATDEIVWDKPAEYVAPRDEKAEASAMKIQALTRGWSTRNGPSVGMRGLMDKPRFAVAEHMQLRPRWLLRMTK